MRGPLLSDITACLAPISDTPALDASVLIAYVLNQPRSWVMAHHELTLTTKQQKHLDNSLMRLKSGEPFPYILGHWEFFGLKFDVTPDTLIPRPETELLVEKAIAWLQARPAKRSVADVGTGSGAIAVSVAINVPDVRILATDISSGALQVAKRNAEKFGVNERITSAECDLLPHPQPPS
ncbi:MAG TPA: HemK/PrmC family methyltransferase, partial [Anaerolineales bacterium]|nr:HemK/PrmC family methyltransferase [Anaerolineales bacterium]